MNMIKGTIAQQTGHAGRFGNQATARIAVRRGKFRSQGERLSTYNRRRKSLSLAREKQRFFTGLTFTNYRSRYYKLSIGARRGLEVPSVIEARRTAQTASGRRGSNRRILKDKPRLKVASLKNRTAPSISKTSSSKAARPKSYKLVGSKRKVKKAVPKKRKSYIKRAYRSVKKRFSRKSKRRSR